MKLQTNFHSSFHHNQPEDFVQSQWQRDAKSKYFLAFRWFLSALFIFIVFFSWTRSLCNGSFGVWWVYMTDWGIFLCMISTTLGALMTSLYHDDALSLNSQSIEYKLYWLLTTIATNLAFVITTFYYSLLYFPRERDTAHKVHGILVHAVNSIAMFIQMLVVKHPMNVWHFIYPMITLIIYFAFTILYYMMGGVNFYGETSIYPVLRWGENNLEASTVAVGLVLLSAVYHLLLCFIQDQREKLSKKFNYKALAVTEN